MSERSANPIKGPRYQFIASAAHRETLGLLQRLHVANNAEEAAAGRGADAGPLLEGALAGVINFAALSGLSAEELEADFLAMVKGIVPQIVMARAEAAHKGGGRA